MTQQNLLELAKQGDAKAIATLMNSQLQPKGLKAKVSIANNCLMVIAESVDPDSTQPPSHSFIVNFVRKGITALNPEEIHRVVVWGKAPGNKAPAWRDDFKLSEPDLRNNFVEQENNFKPQQENIQPENVAPPKPKKPLKLFSNSHIFMQTENLVIAGVIFVLFVFATLFFAGREIFTVKGDSKENIANISNLDESSILNTEITNFLGMYFKASMAQEKKGDEFWCTDSKDYIKNMDKSKDWQLIKINPYGNSSVDSEVKINHLNESKVPTSTTWNIYLKKEYGSEDNKVPSRWCISSIFAKES
ncbi:hypothetical protein Cri9333_3010 [Crinalium epipsammum PCC 9333]|uniref:Uncharacterized protein n=1 Tax=Crinalium epipsammum PCC 9333 TaxID=1173022 RepID=K9W222_9CYAN|nr:hypothetical protein [Crinalium epipsammum]AFZ13849.1 hypothetical protein Cri9333_3010 [Crinalium epipsammum PCC 9333]